MMPAKVLVALAFPTAKVGVPPATVSTTPSPDKPLIVSLLPFRSKMAGELTVKELKLLTALLATPALNVPPVRVIVPAPALRALAADRDTVAASFRNWLPLGRPEVSLVREVASKASDC